MGERTSLPQKTQLTDALAFQRICGVIQACEVTRAYAYTTEYYRQQVDAGLIAVSITLAATDASKGISSDSRTFYHIADSIEEWHRVCARLPAPGVVIPALTAADIEEAHSTGRIAIIFGLQGAGTWLDRDLVLLHILRRLGVRIVGLCYQRRDLFADGSGEPGNAGLSVYGKQFIREMNQLGMVIDLSHMGLRASLEAMELTSQPVIFSHSNVHALVPSVRNLRDEQIDAAAARGGVIGVTAFTSLLGMNVTADQRPTLDDFIAHLDYIVQRVGPDHVGIGLDYAHKRLQDDLEVHNRLHPELGRLDVGTIHAQGLDGPAEVVNLTDRLLRRGYRQDDILKILSGNFLRVFRTVWQ